MICQIEKNEVCVVKKGSIFNQEREREKEEKWIGWLNLAPEAEGEDILYFYAFPNIFSLLPVRAAKIYFRELAQLYCLWSCKPLNQAKAWTLNLN